MAEGAPMSAAKIAELIEAHNTGTDPDERPLADVRGEHYRRIVAALDSLREGRGMDAFLIATFLKNGQGSNTNRALMAEQAPFDLVENHYGWVKTYGERIPKGCGANVYVSNGKGLPVPCWSARHLGYLPSDYIEQRLGGPLPTMDGDYCQMLAESWAAADDREARPMTRVKALNAWAREVNPQPREGVGLESPAPDAVPIPF
jgi:hypothetical protein